MCSISYCRMLNGQNANENIKKLYFHQKERGKNGYGFYNVKTSFYGRSKYEHLILGMLRNNPGIEIMFHARRPTSTVNVENAAHPLCSNDNFKDHKYYLVHNGVIHNAMELYRKHTEDKLVYSSVCEENKYQMPIFNDSESLMFELALIIEGRKEMKDFAAYGSIAFIMIQTDNDGKPLNLYYGRNDGSPLKIMGDRDKLIIASVLDGGQDIAVNKLNEISYLTNEIKSQPMTFTRWSQYTMSYQKTSTLPQPHTGTLEDYNEIHKNLLDGPSIIDGKELMDEDDDVATKTDAELTELEEELTGDLDITERLIKEEVVLSELVRLRNEKEDIVTALKSVGDEISRRVELHTNINKD